MPEAEPPLHLDEPAWPPLLLGLWRDHRRIELHLDELERLARICEGSGRDEPGLITALGRVHRQLLVLAEGQHHPQEESLLFDHLGPVLAHERGMLTALLAEHLQARGLLDELAAAITAGEPGLAGWMARSYVRLMRNHIGAEDAVIFPMALAGLPAAILAQPGGDGCA